MAWKVCVAHPFKNCNKIFPTKQKYVAQVIAALSQDPNVQKLIVFGSSVTSACNPWSDVDIFLELEQNKKVALPPVQTAVDLWTNFSVDSRLYQEIMKKGVTVYERAIAA